jgi:hypothetical protein
MLQRVKEDWGIRDAHLALEEHTLKRMFDLLRFAVEHDEAYGSYLGGEIIAFGERSEYGANEKTELREHVLSVLGHEPGPTSACG